MSFYKRCDVGYWYILKDFLVYVFEENKNNKTVYQPLLQATSFLSPLYPKELLSQRRQSTSINSWDKTWEVVTPVVIFGSINHSHGFLNFHTRFSLFLFIFFLDLDFLNLTFSNSNSCKKYHLYFIKEYCSSPYCK